MKGKFFGVGVGPGDPELITVKGRRLLEECDVVAFPCSAGDRESVALSIVKPYLRPGKERLALDFPMVRDYKGLRVHWKTAAQKVMDRLTAGKTVVFITLGDPTFYSTYGYLVRTLKGLGSGVPVETVPGITAASAAAAVLDESLVEGGERLAVLPAPDRPEELDEIVDRFDSIVLLKVNRTYNRLVTWLADRDLDGQAVFLSRVGQQGQVVEWGPAPKEGHKIDYLSLVIVKQGDRAMPGVSKRRGGTGPARYRSCSPPSIDT